MIERVRAGVDAVEQQMMEHRAKTGARIIGARAIRAQSWTASPTSIEPRRNLRPRFAGRTPQRVAALIGYKLFLVGYQAARRAWLAGGRAIFPPGTFWLAQFAPILVADSIPQA